MQRPAAGTVWRDQIEHLDGIALATEVGTGLFVEFRFWIADNQRRLPGGTLQDHVDTEGPGFLGTAGAVDRQISIEARFFRDADDLSIQLSQDDAVVLANVWNKVQNLLQFLFIHKACRSVGAFIGVSQVARTVILSAAAGPHLHYQQNQKCQANHTDADAIKPIREPEYGENTGEYSGVGKLGCSPAIQRTASGLPDIIVIKELRNVPAAIEQCGQDNGQNDEQFYLCFSCN